MVKWEYKVIDSTKDYLLKSEIYRELFCDFENGLNKLGQDGWKFCGVRDRFMIFIRKIKEI